MIEPHADRPRAITLGADRGYDAADFVEELRTLNIRPHVAQNVSRRRSAIDRRTTRHAWLRRQPAGAKTDRGGVRLDQDRRRPATNQAARPRAGRLVLHLRSRRLQPHPPPQDARGCSMSSAAACARRHHPPPLRGNNGTRPSHRCGEWRHRSSRSAPSAYFFNSLLRSRQTAALAIRIRELY